jgi:hydrogenase nickel incorporation protein HypA/HybF
LHELSIACSLVKTAVDEAARHGVTHVVKMDVVLGALAGVELEALRFCFPAVAKGTVCEGAELSIEVEGATGRCPTCGCVSEVRDFMDLCPQCGGWPLGVEGGRDMRLRALEV